MGVGRRRMTLGGIMAAIAVVALCVAMSRVDAAPGVSVCIFAACTWYLARRRFAEIMGRRSADGVTTGAWRKARILAGCAAIAAVAIGFPDAAFLGGYWGYMAVTRAIVVKPNWRPDSEPTEMLMASLLGLAAALYVASVMRRRLGPIVTSGGVGRPAASHRSAARPLREPERDRVASR